MSEARLDALLAQVAPPPLPEGLAARVAAAAAAQPQEQRPASARRAAGRDRRGAWLRRPLLGGAIALGLAFSGAVAATLAGVPLPTKVAAVIAQIPFVGPKAAEPEHAPVHHATPRPARRAAPAPIETAAAEPAPPPPEPQLRPPPIRRMLLAQRIVARREALGLPTPPVERVERMLHRRQMLRRWQLATPEQRRLFAAEHPRAAAMLQAQLARRDVTPERREAFLAAHPQARAMFEARRALRGATPEQRHAWLAAHPELRAMLEARRARRQALASEPQ